MSESFEVEIYKVEKPDTASNDAAKQADQRTDVRNEYERFRYKAEWRGGQYIANNIRCNISAVRREGDDPVYGRSWTEYESRAPYETSFICHSRTLDACICEAEWVLKDCLFGKAELLDGKYRVATVTKRADDEYTNSNLTRYGLKCKKSEPKDHSVITCIDAFDAYYNEY